MSKLCWRKNETTARDTIGSSFGGRAEELMSRSAPTTQANRQQTNYLVGTVNGFCLTALRIAPLRMQATQTFIDLVPPPGSATRIF